MKKKIFYKSDDLYMYAILKNNIMYFKSHSNNFIFFSPQKIINFFCINFFYSLLFQQRINCAYQVYKCFLLYIDDGRFEIFDLL